MLKNLAFVLVVAFLAMTTAQAQEKPAPKKEAKTMAAKCDHKTGEACPKCDAKAKEAKKECCGGEAKKEGSSGEAKKDCCKDGGEKDCCKKEGEKE